MRQLSKEQKIKLIADIQKGLIPALIFQVVESSIIITQKETYKINGLQFDGNDYEPTIKYLNELGKITVGISSSDDDLVQKLLNE